MVWSATFYGNQPHYIYAEYNPFWIYMGWWLYAAPLIKEPHHYPGVIDREEWPDHDHCVWLKTDWQLDALMKGIELPELHDYRGANHEKSVRGFLERYPIGVVCRVDDGGRVFRMEHSNDLWDYARIIKVIQLRHFAEASETTQEKLEELERQLKTTSV